MFVIAKSSEYFYRPKYYPVKRWLCHVVLKDNQRVFGPATLRACNDYIYRETKRITLGETL